jgi:hypothetical protein
MTRYEFAKPIRKFPISTGPDFGEFVLLASDIQCHESFNRSGEHT